MKNKPRILVAPLDWGIGHATRCVPVIRELMRQGAEVYIASNGRPLKVLQREFPELPTLKLSPYDVHYPFRSMVLNLLLQMPRLLWTLGMEHLQIRRWVKQYHFDGIISDNRLACFHPGVPTVFISHQLNLEAPNALLGRLTNKMNHWFIRRYNRCWVPDRAGRDNLSGSLSRPSPSPNTFYVGPLTRLRAVQAPLQYDVLALLSGPEPQRTYLEKAILRQAADLPYRLLLVQGKPEADADLQLKENIEIVPFLDADALSRAIAASQIVLCRSGYSTLMDLAALGKKALLVPTPGQPEQEYLAEYLSGKGAFVWQDQKRLDLAEGIPAVMALPDPDLSLQNTRMLETAVKEFLLAASPSQRELSLAVV